MFVKDSDKNLKHIELFSGCGGLCLGLKKAGFDLTLANELSPMAAETFAYNFFNEELSDSVIEKRKTLWLGSNYSSKELKKRLHEDPTSISDFKNCELTEDGSNLIGNLIVGNICNLNIWLKSHPQAVDLLKNENIDLIAGGPPCQSFSLAGLREKNNPKNRLPWAFAEFVSLIKPRIVLLENVSGILRPFIEDNKKYYAYFEVAKAFAKIKYIPLCLHINAKFCGCPQNRQRFILLAVNYDFFNEIERLLNPEEKYLFISGTNFFDKVNKNIDTNLKDLKIWDLNNSQDNLFLFDKTFLSPLVEIKENFITVKEAIGDLHDKNIPVSIYVRNLNKLFNSELNQHINQVTAHQIKLPAEHIQRRIKILQNLTHLSDVSYKDLSLFIKQKKKTLENDSWNEIKKFQFLQENMVLSFFTDKKCFEDFLRKHITKKQCQIALSEDKISPTVLSIPDDICHYSALRHLTAREMARLQSFPDSFIFKSKYSTGGKSRRFEVPIYTQIGNAVPVLLGYALGKCIKDLIERNKSQVIY